MPFLKINVSSEFCDEIEVVAEVCGRHDLKDIRRGKSMTTCVDPFYFGEIHNSVIISCNLVSLLTVSLVGL